MVLFGKGLAVILESRLVMIVVDKKECMGIRVVGRTFCGVMVRIKRELKEEDSMTDKMLKKIRGGEMIGARLMSRLRMVWLCCWWRKLSVEG